MNLKRRLVVKSPPLAGGDVLAVQRALNKWVRPAVEIPVSKRFDQRTSDRLQAFQAAEKIKPANGELDQKTLDELVRYMDSYGRMRYRTFSPPPPKTAADLKWERLLAAMRAMDQQSAGYLLGGGHGKPLADVEYDDFLDCSSSTSKALYEAGLFYDWEYAKVSGQLTNWGVPGQGKYFTLYANPEHVWLRLHASRRWWRFDTSPHSDGRPSENPRRGPRLRFLPRFSSSFVARHYPGM